MHLPPAECDAGIHRGNPGHVTAHHFPVCGGPGAAREGGAGGIRAGRGRGHRDSQGQGRPGRRHARALLVLWNGKHKTTGFNAQLISLLDGTAVWISDPLPGKTHDAKSFTGTGAAQIVEKSGGGFGDKGYQGTGLVTPKKKPEGGELTMSDKEYNSQISSLRAPVERLVAHFKNWKIFHADYRRPYRTYLDAFDAARGLFFFSITWGFE